MGSDKEFIMVKNIPTRIITPGVSYRIYDAVLIQLKQLDNDYFITSTALKCTATNFEQLFLELCYDSNIGISLPVLETVL